MRQKGGGRLDLLRRPAVSGALLAVVLAIGAGGLYWWSSGREVRAARARMPEIIALAEKHDVDGFYRAARPVLPLLPDDLHLRNLWINGTMKASFDSLPTGAEVWIKGYTATDREWIRIGTTPLKDERVPFGPNRLRLVKAGFDTVEAPLNPFGAIYPLDAAGSPPEGMLRVARTAVGLPGAACETSAISGSTSSRSPIASSRPSSMRAATAARTCGRSRSPRTAARSHGKRR